MERLVDAIEPPAKKGEEKVAWTAIDDPRLVQRGLEPISEGRAAVRDQAEVELDVNSDEAFVIGIAHPPSFERCAGLSVTISGAGPEKTDTFGTELTQLSVLRDAPLPKTVDHIKLLFKRVPALEDCRDSGQRPIVLSGITRYPLSTAERLNFHVNDANVLLKGFWDVEAPPSGSFVWSHERSTISLSGLNPGVRHRVVVTFRDTAGFGAVELGPDHEHLQKVVITPGRTAAIPDPLMVSKDGTLDIAMKAPAWKPRERFGSEDPRTLGLAVRLVTLDRQDGINAPHERR